MNEEYYPQCHNPIFPRYGGGGCLGEPQNGLNYTCFSCIACKINEKSCSVGSDYINGGKDKENCDRWPLFHLLSWLWGESLTDKWIIEEFMSQAQGEQKLFSGRNIPESIGVKTLFALSDCGAMELYQKCKESRRSTGDLK